MKQSAIIVSPYPLSIEEIDAIKKRFPFLLDKDIVNEVDKNLVAGFIIKFNHQIINLSLNNQLNKIKKQLYET